MVGGLKAEKLLGGNTIEDTQAMIKAKEADKSKDKSAGNKATAATTESATTIIRKFLFHFE